MLVHRGAAHSKIVCRLIVRQSTPEHCIECIRGRLAHFSPQHIVGHTAHLEPYIFPIRLIRPWLGKLSHDNGCTFLKPYLPQAVYGPIEYSHTQKRRHIVGHSLSLPQPHHRILHHIAGIIGIAKSQKGHPEHRPVMRSVYIFEFFSCHLCMLHELHKYDGQNFQSITAP